MALDVPAAHAGIMRRIAGHLKGGTELETFCALLYAGSGTDALQPYEPGLLASLGRSAFEFIAEKPPHDCKLRVRHIEGSGAPGDLGLSLLEVLNDDMPFLVDSVLGEIQARGFAVRLVLHPIIKVRRTREGRLERILGPGDRDWQDGTQESFIAVHLDTIVAEDAAQLEQALGHVLDEVRAAVDDWHAMVGRLDETVAALERVAPSVAPAVLAESVEFCQWLRHGNFTFLGVREFRVDGDEATGELVPVDGSGLGVLRDPTIHVLKRGGQPLHITPEIRRYFFNSDPLIVTKSNIMSTVHRRTLMDYIGLKRYASDGKLSGELRLVGLLTSNAYTQPPSQIPLLRRKVQTVIEDSGYPPESHAGKSLLNVLATFPRDELFRIGEGPLKAWTSGILDLDLRPRVRVLTRPDRFDRFVSALVFIPRDRFSSSVRERTGEAIADAFDGRVSSFTPYFTEGPLVRIYFIIDRNEGPRPDVEPAVLENLVEDIARTWNDALADLIERSDSGGAAGLKRKYGHAFSAGYAETFPVERALEDISRIERLGPELPVAIDFYPDETRPARVRATVYRFGAPIPLSERVPVLENLGFSVIDERSYRIVPRLAGGESEVALHDMMLETMDGTPISLGGIDVRMEDCFLAVFRGEADNDSFNRLIVVAGADWREAAVIRAYGAYLRQIRSPFGLRYIAETLFRHAGLARDIIQLFRQRFDPALAKVGGSGERFQGETRRRLEGALTNVASLDEDRILRQYLHLVLATVRTNFFQMDEAGQPPATLAFKFDSKMVDGLPEPKPFREIWVYSPRVEAIHLRFAPIARGGIRWSDRAQDFRTEVLGLAKAQQVKNTVIVPQGAKGGFLPKALPRGGARDQIMKEGVATYKTFVTALLSVTDNIREGAISPPTDVVRHDGNDPYLVVAADKGTATFSDFANEIAVDHGFWLGDAFASGGSAGYDHKKMAITARGAWECVKRHFREMDRDMQREPFTVIGVGDMSGDVFGNGMLLSPCTRLLAAFDHRDIFLDPDPDPATSFAERKRLFELPRSSWQDYDRIKLSKGGGVFPRTAKSIALSPEIQALLGTEQAALPPFELMRSVLKCRADLLWFGGIGTYVRAAAEADEQVGDRANDPIRVAAGELNCRVIGEGANLGITQRGRVEFARAGGRLNTDFIDNSAGVNSSDQEVNIKIALGPALASGRLSQEGRLPLLASMTGDVAAACLDNNYQQSLAISLAEQRSASDIGYLSRLMRTLESRGTLDRGLEALPNRAEVSARQNAGHGFTRPELAVLLAQAKLALSYDLLESPVPDDPVFEPLLLGYFPSALRENFAADLKSHRLAREIVATVITNAMINRGGPAFAIRLADETGRTTPDAAVAFMSVCAAFGLPELWPQIDALDDKLPGAVQLALYARVQDLVIEQTAGFLRRSNLVVSRSAVASVASLLDKTVTEKQRTQLAAARAKYEGEGITTETARRIADLDFLSLAPAIVRLAEQTGRELGDVAPVAFAAAEYFRISELKARAAQLKVSDYYDRLALSGALSALETAASALSRDALADQDAGPAGFAAWLARHGARLERAKVTLDEMADSGDVTVSRLTVAATRVRDLASA